MHSDGVALLFVSAVAAVVVVAAAAAVAVAVAVSAAAAEAVHSASIALLLSLLPLALSLFSFIHSRLAACVVTALALQRSSFFLLRTSAEEKRENAERSRTMQ